ncbi:MAG TPA: NAD(P)/FAD-dependent oxidoreductase [Blastocatellia bacterium]|nr:NAD(P)/FAD-dependent oxidoreductase [Blastocatellia bacterium]
MTANTFDAVIIGGGHNGLVTAAYLARAGLSVVVLERREVIGGACVTEEVWPGYKVSTLAYLCSLLQPRIIRELELARFGFHLYPKDPAFFTAFPDGRHLFFWQDMARTQTELAKFSKRDSETYPDFEHQLARLGDWVEDLLMTTPPNIIRRKLGDMIGLGKLGLEALRFSDPDIPHLIKIMTQSVRAYLDERFESEQIKATLATDGVIGTNGGPSTPGTAYIMLHHVMGGATGTRGLWGFVRGGMGAISEAIARSATASGAQIRTGTRVDRVLVRNGRAYGVALDDGEEIHARVIISNADPKVTFLKLVDPVDIDADFRAEVQKIRMEGCSMKINLALDALPDFTTLPGSAVAPQHKATIHVCPSMEYVDRAWEDSKQGRPSDRPLVEITIPTAYDDSIAPPGKHIMCIFAQYAPYTLRDADWDTIKDEFADRCIDAIADYAPNIREAIIHRQVVSPLDMEREYSLTGGNIFHGDMTLDQLFFMRPVAGWARYRTPIDALYMCGSGTHPGGGVMGAPGFNAAREVLSDWRGRKLA